MPSKTEQYYHIRLDRYFNKYYGAYSETAEFYNNPATNIWKFIIPELGIEVTLTCNDIGWVNERRERLL